MLFRLILRSLAPCMLCALWLALPICFSSPFISVAIPALAQDETPTLTLSPPYVAEGGSLRVSGYGFPPDSGFVVQLQTANASQTYWLGLANTGPNETTFGPVTFFPSQPIGPGNYTLLIATLIDEEILARLPVTILPGPEIVLDPAGGPPGTEVKITVHNLLTGSLRIDYAGVGSVTWMDSATISSSTQTDSPGFDQAIDQVGLAVIGPTAVNGGSFEGTFIVPNDRPVPLGETATVRAFNTVNGLLVGSGKTSFQSQAGGPPAYQIRTLTIPEYPAERGQSFVIQGKIEPPPLGDLSQYQVVPMWHSAGGSVFPISLGTATIQTDGAYSIVARLPSLLAGDPAPAEQSDQLTVQLLSPGTMASPIQVDDTPVAVPGAVLNVKVVEKGTEGTSNEVTIEGAKIRVVPANSTFYQAATDIVALGTSQLQAALDPNGDGGLTEEEKQLILQAQAMCKLLSTKTKPANFPWELIDPTLESMFVIPTQQKFSLQNTALEGALVTSAANNEVIVYNIIVDAIAQGYGEVDSNLQVMLTTHQVSYNTQTKLYLDKQGNPIANPYVIAIPKLPPEVVSPLGPIPLYWQGLPEDTIGKTGTVYGVYYSTVGVPPNTEIPPQTSTIVRAYLEPGKHQLLAENGLKLLLDGKVVGTFEVVFLPNVNCNPYSTNLEDFVPVYEGKLTLTNLHLLTPGKHSVGLQATLKDGSSHLYTYGLQMKSLPAWFLQGSYKRQKVTWTPSLVQLYAVQFDKEDDPEPLAATLPYYGPVNNESGLDYSVYQKLSPDGSQTPLKNYGGTRAISWNTAMGTVAIAGQNTAATVQAAGTIQVNESQTLDRQTHDLGKVTVFGVPYIADVSVGLKVWYEASLAVAGTVTVQALDQAPTVDLTVRPSATAGADAYGDLTILFDIAADAQLHFLPSINVNMPVRFTGQGVSNVDVCFKYRMDYKWIVRIGCVPEVCVPVAGCTGGWCLVNESGTGNIFGGNVPTSDACQPWADQVFAAQEEAGPPSLKPAMATDGLGHTFAIWRSLDGSIAVSRYDGAAWGLPLQLTQPGTAPAAGPGVAFYAPNRAIAVWVASAIDEAPPAPLSAEEAVQAQYIAYALWDGANWSQPEALTSPNSGDGGVVIAGCGTPAQPCVNGGTVTVVWVHYVDGPLVEHRFRLSYSTFSGGEWSGPQPVDPLRFDGSEGQPSLAYQDNIPVLLWVRDTDRSYNTAADRRLWLRILDGVGVPQQVADLPVVAASLAIQQDGSPFIAFTVANSDNLIGSQSELFVAYETCGLTCFLQIRLLRDGYGRSLRAERAVVTLDDQDRPTITFRGLGFGPDAQGNLVLNPQDPPGMVQQTGELAQVHFDPALASVAPSYWTQDGGVNWQPAALYDPQTNNTLVMAVNVPELGPLQASVSQAAQHMISGEPLIFGAARPVPDFVLTGGEVDSLYATSKVTVTLENRGASWAGGSDAPLEVVATWDGAPGVGTPAGSATLTALDDAVVQIVLALKQIGAPGQPHRLIVAANPGQIVGEANGDNNRLTFDVGGLPVPSGLTSTSADGKGVVLLEWTESPDARVAGYRVYRAAGDGVLLPLGSSPVAGYADVTAKIGQSYRYAITAYSAAGVESSYDENEVAEVTIGMGQPVLYLPRIRR